MSNNQFKRFIKLFKEEYELRGRCFKINHKELCNLEGFTKQDPYNPLCCLPTNTAKMLLGEL